MLANTLRSILNAPRSIVWGSNAKHFYKLKAFVAPEASTLSGPDKSLDVALTSPHLCDPLFIYKREMVDSLPDLVGIQPVDGCWVSETGGISILPLSTSYCATAEGHQETLSFPSPSTISRLSSDQSPIFSHLDSGTSTTTHTTSSDIDSHIDGIPGWPRPITPLTPLDIMSCRLAGEKIVDESTATSIVSGTSLIRMKAIAGWATGFIYAQIMGAISSAEPVVSIYNADVHARVADRIETVLESTSLPPSTVFLALWYISRFPFTVHATEGNSPRATFFRLLRGYGEVRTEETMFLVFVAGAMLANKANDDFCLSVYEWHCASLYQIDDLKYLELCALKHFGWSIIVDSAQWDQWMSYVTTYHSVLARYQAISRDYGVVAAVIDKVNRQDPHWHCDCESKSTVSSSPCDFSASHHTDTDSSGPSPPTYSHCQSYSPPLPLPDLSNFWQPKADPIIHRSSQDVVNVAPGAEREPAPWCPSADPIVEASRPVRTMGTAPGSRWIKPITVIDILENITAGRYPLLPRTNRNCSAETVNSMPLRSSKAIGRV